MFPIKSAIRQSIRVCITGASGKIAYSFLPFLLSGQVFGKTKIQLNLLATNNSQSVLKGLAMELRDGLFPCLKSVSTGHCTSKMFEGADVIVFLGAHPRKEGMERKDQLQLNKDIFKEQGQALHVASSSVKCLVVSNPCNSNAAILHHYSKNKIPPQNITCLTRLDQNRAINQISAKTGADYNDIENVIVFGNHSHSMYPLIEAITIKGTPLKEIVGEEWLKNYYIETVAKRAVKIIETRKGPAILSSAIAIRDHLYDWYHGTDGKLVSMGVRSEGDYGIPKGVWASLPVTCSNFQYNIVKSLKINQFSKERIKVSGEDLLEELKKADISL